MSCPTNIYGPLEHTLFLGASVVKFSAQAGWNTNVSDLTVEVVEDSCRGTKYYYDGCGQKQVHSGPDRFNPPPLGSPVYFKFGSFEFCGILQNWQERHSSNGKFYTVKIISPQDVLDGTQVILDGYTGETFEVPNLLNVYGYLEDFGSRYNTTTPTILPSGLDQLLSYIPADGFGGALRTDAGLPWYQIREALCMLVNGMDFDAWKNAAYNLFADTSYRKYGYKIKFRGYSYYFDFSSLPFIDEYLRINQTSISLLQLITQVCEYYGRDFILEMAFLPSDKLNGAIRTIVGVDNNPYPEGSVEWANWFSGHIDYSTAIVLRALTIHRDAQPKPALDIDSSVGSPVDDRLDRYGAVTSIAAQYDIPYTDTSRGLELRNEVTNSVLVGDNRCDIWRVYHDNYSGPRYIGWSEGLAKGWILPKYDDRMEGSTYKDDIWNYWGKTKMGYPIVSSGWQMYQEVLIELDNCFPDAIQQVIDLVCTNSIYILTGTEIACILTDDMSVWEGYVTNSELFNRPLTDVVCYQKRQLFIDGATISTPIPNTNPVQFREEKTGLLKCVSVIDTPSFGKNGAIAQKLIARGAKPMNIHRADWQAAYVTGQLQTADESDEVKDAIELLYNHLRNIVTEYYGKKFIVKVPFLTAIRDKDNPLQIKTNWEPTDSAWTEINDVIGLSLTGVFTSQYGGQYNPLDVFKDSETGKIKCFVHFDCDYKFEDNNKIILDGGIDVSRIPKDKLLLIPKNQRPKKLYYNGVLQESTVPHDVYILATVEELVFLDPINLTEPRVVISIDEPCFPYFIRVPLVNAEGFPIWQRDAQGLDKTEYVNASFKQAGQRGLSIGQKKGGIAGSDITTWYPFAPYPIIPNAVALPMRSNTLCYGPWRAMTNGAIQYGVDCKTEFIKDNSFAPWNFGSTHNMNLAANIMVQSKVAQHQVSEVATLNVPGAPVVSLGRCLVANGPEVTNIDVNIGGDGITTNYQMRTYTPNYGSFSKTQIDNIGRVGRTISKIDRTIGQAIKSESYNRVGKGFNGITALTTSERYKRSSSHNFILATSDIATDVDGYATDSGVLKNGVLTPWVDYSGGIVDTDRTEQILVTTDTRKCLGEIRADDPVEYQKRAGCENIGLFRPFTTLSGEDAHMAEMAITKINEGPHVSTDNCNPNDHYNYSNNSSPPHSPVFNEGCPPICATTLDPFLASGCTYGGFQLGSGMGHDIDYIIRGVQYPNQLSIFDTNSYDQDHYYRSIGLRGPLILVGWGYDTAGKPVPNRTEDSDGKATTAFFKDDWLRKAEDWKAGPVDLRWDNKRGVWTAPNPINLVKVKLITSNITPSAILYDNVIHYNIDGEAITEPLIRLYNPTSLPVVSGSWGWAVYNPDYSSSVPNYAKYNLISVSTQSISVVSTAIANRGTVIGSSYGADLNGQTLEVDGLPDVPGFYASCEVSGYDQYGNPILSIVYMSTPTAGGTLTDDAEVEISKNSQTYTRTCINSLNVPVGKGVTVQWSSTEWIVIGYECYETPIHGVVQ